MAKTVRPMGVMAWAMVLWGLVGGSIARAEAPAAPPERKVPAPTSAPTTTAPAEPAPVKYFSAPKDGWPKEPETGFQKKVWLLADSGKALHKNAWFHLSVPKGYSPDKAWPVVVILHGGPGGKPDDIVGFFRGGMDAQGVISVYPNAMVHQLLEWNYPHSAAYTLSILKQIARTYRLDPSRLYLMGVSMGGGGTWVQGALGREVWAALGPISGWFGASLSPDTTLLRDMPIYIMHGKKDRQVPALLSHRAVAALQALKREVKVCKETPEPADVADDTCVYREIAEGKHNCFLPWKKHGQVELGLMVSWMLRHRRDSPADLDKAMQRIAEHGRKFGWHPEGSPVGNYGQPAKRRPSDRSGSGDKAQDTTQPANVY